MINLESIPKHEQANMLSSFWTMLQECETVVMNSKDGHMWREVVLKHWVEQWYEQWNRVTGDNKKPRWAEENVAT